MARRWFPLRNRKQRSVLTDMLPFEVPPTFSNHGFYRFLRNNGVEIGQGQLRWVSNSPGLDVVMRLIFGFPAAMPLVATSVIEWGKEKQRKAVRLNACQMDTIPFAFRIAHNVDGRTLTVVHPRNQVAVANFYANHYALIIYYTSLSEFSIRRPVSVSKFAYFKDKLHEQTLDVFAGGIEEEGREYEQLGSYFVYKDYRNIHRFFESYKYHRCEKKYNAMVQIDLSRCFDSIYTHSLSWAILGKSQTKFNLDESKFTFAGQFDSLMQNLNHNETNGIVIGPEFSRIFAEIILQAIDADLMARLSKTAKLDHKVHYQIFRYVDDYFVFYNDESTQQKIREVLQEALKEMKLSINSAKVKHYEKPIITEITIAKDRISSLLNSEIEPNLEERPRKTESEPRVFRFVCSINANRLIVRYKTALKEAGVSYSDLLNYTYSILENKLDRLLKLYADCERTDHDSRRLIRAMLAIVEFSFFAYSASPKVNHTIRLCRIVSTCVEFLRNSTLPYDLRHLLFKYVHDNINQQIEKNAMGAYREVETLYLLISLGPIGREYWLPEATLLKHFLISKNDDTGEYDRPDLDFMSHFSITVLLSYMKSKSRYNKLRKFVEKHAVSKLLHNKARCHNDTEAILLFLDLLVCPYISDSTKEKMGDIFGLDAAAVASVQGVNEQWFTIWGDKFNLKRELDAKRSREVY